MKVEFDQNKSDQNANERGLPFDLVSEFDWETNEDTRFAYPERRFVAFGYIGRRVLHAD